MNSTLGFVVPLAMFAYIHANTRNSVIKKLTFPNYEFGKGQYTFFPVE